MNSVVLQPCSPNEFDELLRFLDQAFGKRPERWFARHKAHIFLRTPESIARHRLVRDEHGIAGVTGMYPSVLRIGPARLSVGGVGSVAVRSDRRGQGLMSCMLQQTLRVMENERYDLSWLSGNRFRYGNYGWELGGRTMTLSVERADIVRRFPTIRPVRPRKPRGADMPVLDSLYRRLGSGVERSRDTWAAHLRGEGHRFAFADRPDGAAYLVYRALQPDHIIEIGGVPDVATALLLGHGHGHKCNRLHVGISAWSTALEQRLFAIAADFGLTHCKCFRVIDEAGAWKKLKPLIARRGRLDGVSDAGLRLDSVVSGGARRLLLGRALGFYDDTPPLPPRLRYFEWIRPLGWWLSPLDGV